MKAVYSDKMKEFFREFPEAKRAVLEYKKPFELLYKKPNGNYRILVAHGMDVDILITVTKD